MPLPAMATNIIRPNTMAQMVFCSHGSSYGRVGDGNRHSVRKSLHNDGKREIYIYRERDRKKFNAHTCFSTYENERKQMKNYCSTYTTIANRSLHKSFEPACTHECATYMCACVSVSVFVCSSKYKSLYATVGSINLKVKQTAHVCARL